jgi:hypothetical protein
MLIKFYFDGNRLLKHYRVPLLGKSWDRMVDRRKEAL